MVSVKLNKYVFQVGETVVATIENIPLFTIIAIQVLNKGQQVYSTAIFNMFGSSITHTFNAMQSMIGQNKLIVIVYMGLVPVDKTETYFSVYSIGEDGGDSGNLCDSIIRTIIQFITQNPYMLLLLAIPLILLLKRKK